MKHGSIPHIGTPEFNDDILSSEDGETWTTVNTEKSWAARSEHGMEFLQDKVFLWGGADWGYGHLHDVWVSEGDGVPMHTADANRDFKLSMSELLRLIQFYNIGAFHCDANGEDGYAPGPGDHNCAPHASDYNAQDWGISLSELLRAIQFYNSPGGYTLCQDGEDGYCPVL